MILYNEQFDVQLEILSNIEWPNSSSHAEKHFCVCLSWVEFWVSFSCRLLKQQQDIVPHILTFYPICLLSIYVIAP